MTPAEVDKITAEILTNAAKLQDDTPRQLFCLTQAVCLLAVILIRSPNTGLGH